MTDNWRTRVLIHQVPAGDMGGLLHDATRRFMAYDCRRAVVELAGVYIDIIEDYVNGKSVLENTAPRFPYSDVIMGQMFLITRQPMEIRYGCPWLAGVVESPKLPISLEAAIDAQDAVEQFQNAIAESLLFEPAGILPHVDIPDIVDRGH